MREITTYSDAVEYLTEIFDLLNNRFFECALSKPTITIYSTPKYYGHFTTKEDTWVSDSGGTHEINIDAGTLGRPIIEIAETLLHEMVHYYNYVNKIKDTSRYGSYHNRKFKETAEAHGLIVQYNKRYGWNQTFPGKALMDFVNKCGLTDIKIQRNNPDNSSEGSSKSSTRKYLCLSCGISVRAAKDVNIACIDCGKKMVLLTKNLQNSIVILLGIIKYSERNDLK